MPDAKPLSAEELDALKFTEPLWICLNCGRGIKGPLTDDNHCPCDVYEADWLSINGLFDTVRDRERERDAAIKVRDGSHAICWSEDARQQHEIARLKAERDELQRRLAEIEADMEWISQAIAEDKINLRHFGRPDESIRDAIRAARIAQGQAHD